VIVASACEQATDRRLARPQQLPHRPGLGHYGGQGWAILGEQLFPCKIQRIFKENVYIKHLFCYLTLIFFVHF
jgi:hypothetical protein